MAQLIVIEGGRARRDMTVEQSWDNFVRLSAKAKQSNRIEDGIAAGKAYADFIDLFTRETPRG